MMGDIETAFSSSLGALAIVVKSVYSTLMYLYNSFNDNFVQKQFSIFHNFVKTYQDNIEYIFNDKGIITYSSFVDYFAHHGGSIYLDDKTGQKLYNANIQNDYLVNGAKEKIKVTYSTAIIMIVVEELDLFNANRELIIYVIQI